jgi:hypothetical protein
MLRLVIAPMVVFNIFQRYESVALGMRIGDYKRSTKTKEPKNKNAPQLVQVYPKLLFGF